LTCDKGDTTAAPHGSYRATCINLTVRTGILFANCRAKNGENVNTWLRAYAKCRGDIGNNDGLLRCNNGLATPPGSYTKSCVNIFNNDGELNAQCKTKSQQWKRPVLAGFAACRGDIGNNDGSLTCAK
jgi:hypothetical protein